MYCVFVVYSIILFMAYADPESQDRISFPDDFPKKGTNEEIRGNTPKINYEEKGHQNNVQVSLDFIQNINSRNLSDLLLNFIEGEEETHNIQSRFGDDDDIERSAAVLAKAAGCLPELQTVKIASSQDPTIIYIPECTRIERCGGCCSHKLLSCQPQEIETVNFKVMKTQYTGRNKLKFVGKEIVPVERHTKCKCDCKKKASDCSKYQQYNKSECSCVCTNTDEEKKCYKNNNLKLWNPELCLCQCREILECSTGFKFDQNECHCVPARRRDVSEPHFDLIFV